MNFTQITPFIPLKRHKVFILPNNDNISFDKFHLCLDRLQYRCILLSQLHHGELEHEIRCRFFLQSVGHLNIFSNRYSSVHLLPLPDRLLSVRSF